MLTIMAVELPLDFNPPTRTIGPTRFVSARIKFSFAGSLPIQGREA
jgi:hypothetical protein